MVQLAINPVEQLARIEARASIALQAYGSGEDTAELAVTMLACVAAIFTECHDPELTEMDKINAYAELVEDVEADRVSNMKVFFAYALP